ncbi:hypothetical protein MIR68_006052 [Amoeboaphelidium protococcarum]|nr:hypothetical protein MIR68_006052 [Amoeboaphelidium protococcarum]KAI3648895.1 hypothetical protein MP228_006749 [Amoeboaphelidium protococcarum]
MKTAIERIGKALGSCSMEAMTYGKCVVAKLDCVEKDACAKEFRAFQQCCTKHLRKR